MASAKKRKSTGDEDTFREKVLTCVRRENGAVMCAIDEAGGCKYSHPEGKFDSGNFLRHLRQQHVELAKKKKLFRSESTPENPPKRARVAKIPVAINQAIVKESLVRLVTTHNLPLSAVEWKGFRLMLDPIGEATSTTINRVTVGNDVDNAARMIRAHVADEVRGKLVSLKIDSASQHGRHVLGVNIQFVNSEKKVEIRTIGVVEVKERQTAKVLKDVIINLIKSYDIQLIQIISITSDNGSNMVAAGREIQHEYILENLDDEELDPAFMDELVTELKNAITVVRCAVHTQQLAVVDVTKHYHAEIRFVTKAAKNSRKIQYQAEFERRKMSLPPLYAKTRWGGVFCMMQHFSQNRQNYEELGVMYNELDLSDQWDFVEHFVEAFLPVHICTKRMQERHVSLTDFYIEWLDVMRKVGGLAETNRFKEQLMGALQTRLDALKNNILFKAAAFLDPRINFEGSKALTPEDKAEVEVFLHSTWDRLQRLNGNTEGAATGTSAEGDSTQEQPANPNTTSPLDEYLTGLFGDSPQVNEPSSTFTRQLNSLSSESRLPAAYDVWEHWVGRLKSHPELAVIALAIHAIPSNQVSVERAFSGLGLILTKARTLLSEEHLNNILLVKLNESILDGVANQLFSV